MTKKVVKKKKTDIVPWEQRMSEEASIAAGMEEGVGGGQFFSLKSGILSWMDSPIPNNEMVVIIIDSILENVLYEGDYDPDNIQGPTCFAFGRDVKKMAPHKLVIDAGNQLCGISGLCEGCENNEWGSADTGKGKACRNTRRLALIPAGTLDKNGEFQLFDNTEHFKTAQPGYMKLPVTSVKGYASFVTQIASSLKRPPYGVLTKISVIPDTKSQFKVVFQPLNTIPDKLMPIIMQRHEEIGSLIDFPYTPFEDEVKPVKSKAAKKPGKVKKKRKY